MPKRITVEIIDVHGSFARFLKQAPKVLRSEVGDGLDKSADAMLARIHSLAPVGPDAPHMRDALQVRRDGSRLSFRIGVFDPEQAAVALYNEYRPNRQPFMMPAAEDEAKPFVQRATKALKNLERLLSL